MTGATVNFALITELGPVLTGLMLAGRVGSSIAAELGSMKVSEQIDALRVMGTDPISYLVAPRFLACAGLLPVLTALCMIMGISGAAFLANYVWQLDEPTGKNMPTRLIPGKSLAAWAKSLPSAVSLRWSHADAACEQLAVHRALALLARRRLLAPPYSYFSAILSSPFSYSA